MTALLFHRECLISRQVARPLMRSSFPSSRTVLLYGLPRAFGLHAAKRHSTTLAGKSLVLTRNMLSRSYPLRRYQQHHVRGYLYLPTSWTEFRLRMRNQAEKRTIQVKLFLDNHSKVRHRNRSSSWTEYLANRSKQTVSFLRGQQGASPLYARFRLAAHNQADKWRMYKTQQATRLKDQARVLKLKARDWMNTTSAATTTVVKLPPRRLKRKDRAGRILPAAAFWVRNSSVPLLLRKRSNAKSLQSKPSVADSSTVSEESVSVSQNQHHALKPTYRNRLRSWYYRKVTLTEYSERSWFDGATGKPMVSRDATGRFVNPWMSQSSDGVHSISTILRWRWRRFENEWRQLFEKYIGNATAIPGIASETQSSTDESNKSVYKNATASSTALADQTPSATNSNTHVQFTWLGHSTCLLQQENITILTDPNFSERSSPFVNKWIPIGVPRLEDAYLPNIDKDLPSKIDICLISHDHYDHLDKPSVLALKDKVQCWVVPIGIGDWLQEKCGIVSDQIVELEWWETVRFHQQDQVASNDNDSSSSRPSWKATQRFTLQQHRERHPIWSLPNIATGSEGEKSLWVTCCPAQHWCSRTFFDRNYRLWCSFACYLPPVTASKSSRTLSAEPFLFYFAGDTARPNNHFPLFEQIADYLARPVDLAALPIGAYAPKFLSQDAHMNPAEAVSVHRALRSKQSVGIHWGTFALAEEPADEPVSWLRQEMKGATDFVTLSLGGSLRVLMTPLIESAELEREEALFISEEDEELKYGAG